MEFWGAACAVGCVSELRRECNLNHLNRTSDEAGKAIQPEKGSAIQPEAQAGCQGLNISKLSVLNGSSGSSSLRADLKFLIFCQLAYSGPQVPFPLLFLAASTLFQPSYEISLLTFVFFSFSLYIYEFHGFLFFLPPKSHILEPLKSCRS